MGARGGIRSLLDVEGELNKKEKCTDLGQEFSEPPAKGE